MVWGMGIGECSNRFCSIMDGKVVGLLLKGVFLYLVLCDVFYITSSASNNSCKIRNIAVIVQELELWLFVEDSMKVITRLSKILFKIGSFT